MSYIQCTAPSGLEYRIYNDHIDVSVRKCVWETIDGTWNKNKSEEKKMSKFKVGDDIFDINVIVPDKVVEIEFYDGKEKMVCHEDDTFDLRKCCFIAIAKHLYKQEYTQEGIEYMAT